MNTSQSPAVAAATQRFERIDESVVRDTTTALEWTRDNVSDRRLTWQEAKDACAKLDLAGGGWRLPTRAELLTLVDDTRYHPAIDPAFECKPNYYWTVTPYAPDGDYAWYVFFYDGGAGAYRRDNGGFVRAVRGGQ